MCFQIKHVQGFLLITTILSWLVLSTSCTSDSTFTGDDDIDMPPDTTIIVEPMDTIAGIVCNPDTIYFELEVLPIFVASCGQRDCHSAGRAYAGFKGKNYETIVETGGVVPYLPEEARVYRQITHVDDEERMPPSSYDRLSDRQGNFFLLSWFCSFIVLFINDLYICIIDQHFIGLRYLDR